MKIAQACFRFGAPGGAEDHVLQISRELVKRGHEVTVHTSDIFTETPWVRGDWGKGTGFRGQGSGEKPGYRVEGSGEGTDACGVNPAPCTLNPEHTLNAEPCTLYPHEIIDGIKVIRHKAYIRPLSTRWSMLVMPDMISGLLKQECDLYHGHSHRYFQLEAAASAARAKGKPLIITPHYHPAEEKETLRTKVMLKLYDLYSSGSLYSYASKVLTMTDLEKGFLKGIVSSEKCSTVGAGIDAAEWDPVQTDEVFRKETGIDGKYLLYSGRLATNKGLEHLFAAMPSILKDFDGQLVVLGKDWGMKMALVEQARKGGFEKKVRFIDFLPDRSLYKSALAGCELFVLPSQWEAFGIVLLEAAMCRRPVVATTVGGVPEVVRRGETGSLVPYGDSKALADAVTGLLGDAERMKRMGEEGRRLALERHTWPKVVDRILKAYGEVMG